MSREQWGHGFYTGLKAQTKGLPKYCVTFDKADNNHIEYIFIVQGFRGETYILEAINYMWFVVNGFAEPSKSPIDPDNVYEKKASELNNPKWFYSWESVIKAFKEDERLYRKEQTNAKVQV